MLREQGGPHLGCVSGCSAGHARCLRLSKVGLESAAIETPHLAPSESEGCDEWNFIGCCHGWAKR